MLLLSIVIEACHEEIDCRVGDRLRNRKEAGSLITNNIPPKKTVIKIRLLFGSCGEFVLALCIAKRHYGLFESVIGMVFNPPRRSANFSSETSAMPSFLILVRKALHLIKQLILSSSTSYYRPFIFTRPPVEIGSDQDFFLSNLLNSFINRSLILQSIISINSISSPRQLFHFLLLKWFR